MREEVRWRGGIVERQVRWTDKGTSEVGRRRVRPQQLVMLF